MHRQPLFDLLARYRSAFPAEAAVVDRISALMAAHTDCLLRSCRPGHVTASAFIVDATGRRFLLTHHKKLDRWLQLGGHVDGEAHVLHAALREAREESGMHGFDVVPVDGVAGLPLDVDVHTIPARGAEPEHEHHDVRFLLRARPGQEPVCSDESHAVAWFELATMESVLDEESVLRLGRKARVLLSP
ncbi:MAG: NUDIX hydrolase [Planctomycetota bacterium]